MKTLNYLLTALGFFCVALGGAALFVPLVPTTPFLLLAGVCLARGSSRHHQWLCAQPWYRHFVGGYLNGEGVPLRSKVLALAMLWCAIGISGTWMVSGWWPRVAMVVIASAVTLLVLKLKTRPARVPA